MQVAFSEAAQFLRETLGVQMRELERESPDALWSVNYHAAVLSTQVALSEPAWIPRETLGVQQGELGREHLAARLRRLICCPLSLIGVSRQRPPGSAGRTRRPPGSPGRPSGCRSVCSARSIRKSSCRRTISPTSSRVGARTRRLPGSSGRHRRRRRGGLAWTTRRGCCRRRHISRPLSRHWLRSRRPPGSGTMVWVVQMQVGRGGEACRGLGLRSATVVLGAGDHEFLGGLGSLRDCGAEVAPRRRSGDCRALRRSGGDGLMDSGAQVVLRRRSGDLSGIAHSGGLPDSCPIDGREVSKFPQRNAL